MEKLKLGIILGSTRQGRVSPQVGQWVERQAEGRERADYELIDIADYNLPLLGEGGDTSGVKRWNEKLDEKDGFIFIVPEYNHSLTAALKNALDSAREAWYHKAAGIVSYGSGGGVRAAEHLRNICAELNMADVRSHVLMSLFDDFKEFSEFNPRSVHEKSLQTLFDQVESWASALKTLR